MDIKGWMSFLVFSAHSPAPPAVVGFLADPLQPVVKQYYDQDEQTRNGVWGFLATMSHTQKNRPKGWRFKPLKH